MDILELIIGAVVGFVIGIFVYRNNVDMFAPIAAKIDVKFDEMKREIAELKAKVDRDRI